MNCQLLSNITVDATHVALEIDLSRLSRLYLDIDQPIDKRKSKYTAERKQSLLDCMSATWETISKVYFQTGYFLTPEIRKAEEQIEDIQAKVLDGRASLSDFRRTAKRWEKAVISARNMSFQNTINYVSEINAD